MRFNEIYDIFIIIYIQIYMLYNSKTIKFNLIIYNAINEKHRIFIIKKKCRYIYLL